MNSVDEANALLQLFQIVKFLGLSAIGFFVVMTVVYQVRGKTAAILETFGKPHKRAQMPGLRVKAPWPITKVVARVNLQQQELGADISVKTKDNAYVTLPVKVQYRASDKPEGAVLAHYELESPEKQIASYVLNNVRQTASGMDMTELFENRDRLESQVQAALTDRFARFGYVIENVLVDQPQPSREVQDASNRVIASARLKDAAINEAAAIREKLVGAARAEAESKKLQGEGIANMRKAIAEGLEESVKIMEKAGISAQEAIALLTETNRLDTISHAAAHGNMIIVDTKSTQIGETVAAVRAATLAKPSVGESVVSPQSVDQAAKSVNKSTNGSAHT